MNIGILITARLKSTRLQLKAIKPIMDRPMICHLLDRLKLSNRAQQIIVCTSTISQDDKLEEIAKQEGIKCFRGHPDDVLLRMTNAAEQFGLDLVISCTADNPFVDPKYIDQLVNFHLKNNYDYSESDGLPFGTFAYTLSYSAMVDACEIKNEKDTEVWAGYFKESGKFSWGVMQVDDPDVRWPELRLTVDTPEDFELVSRIFDELYVPGKIFSLKNIITLCRRRPDFVMINKHIQQKEEKPITLKES